MTLRGLAAGWVGRIAVEELLIRFAEEEDEGACALLDPQIPPYFLTRRIEQREVIVAELDGEVVACLRFEFLGAQAPMISLLAVRQDLQGEGIGRHLVEFLEEYLRDLGYNDLLFAAREGSPDFEGWLRRLGFHECGFLSGMHPDGSGEVFFRKTLE
jgi:N-acetylglutamate synthase-like GNAT family acetyltransferase